MIDLPKLPSFRLDGRRALVTGASSGIGLGAAAALAEAGAHVTLVARRETELKAVAEAIRASGGLAETCSLDITDRVTTAVCINRLGPFDILVNSAGLARHSPALETEEDDFDAALALNLKAAYFLTREVARGLIAAGRPGSLINVSSQMGLVGGPDRAVYCAAKHGLEGMTKAMALEWGAHGIRVNTLCPTFIRTPLAEQTLANPERRAWILSKIKLGRIGEITDLMGPIVFLASDASALVTGTHLLVDGGWTAE
ncbi:MAG: SDR family NAD(P)-dependent oxidoreductase [Pannonibacter sp.]|jgi:NAD(P)-dependent dehydrogenase (short-subunit alcohol dehydrogenase family)